MSKQSYSCAKCGWSGSVQKKSEDKLKSCPVCGAKKGAKAPKSKAEKTIKATNGAAKPKKRKGRGKSSK